MLDEWLLFLSAIPTIIIPGAYAGLQDLSKFGRSYDSERTMKIILESCYDGDSLSGVVVVAGKFNEYTDKLPIIRPNYMHKNNRSSSLVSKPTTVIMTISSRETLLNHIHTLKYLGWWNHMASFFIVSHYQFSCKNAYEILFSAFQMDMINSIYICPESMNTSSLRTLNPYDNYAPHPWEKVGEFAATTLFGQRFDRNVSCSSMHYDKTKNLNGHQIRVWATDYPGTYSDSEKYHLNKYASRNDFRMEIINTICGALNCSYVLHRQSESNSAEPFLSERRADLTYNLFSIEDYSTVKFLFPHHHDRIVAIIKSRSEESTQSKIFHLWDCSVIFLAATALMILFLILLWKNRGFSSALLDVIRLIIYSSILTNIRSHSFRIFFATILIMMIISNGVFQGKIAAFLTAHEKNRPIERIETLVQLGYKFYNSPGLERVIRSHCPECDTRTVPRDDCIDYVLKDKLTACLTEEFTYRYYAFMPLDLVKKPLVETLLVTEFRDDWPLYDRMNDMWMRVFESGLQNFWATRATHWSLTKRREQDIERSSTDYQPIKLYKLWFAFQFLAIGLTFSTVVFIAELLIKTYGNSP